MAKPKLKRRKIAQSAKRNQQATASFRKAYGTQPVNTTQKNSVRENTHVTAATMMNWEKVS